MFIHWLIFFLLIPALEGWRNMWKSDDSRLGEQIMKEILTSCYQTDDLSSPTLIFGDFNVILESPVIRMDKSLVLKKDSEKPEIFHLKPSKIIIVVNSPEELHSDLMLLKKTQSWNYSALFFIMNKSWTTGCGNFTEMLNVTWKMDIINSIYICPESLNTSALYTLNPMADYAPDPWRKVEDLHDVNVFRQVFNRNVSCDNLTYDKTKILHGYEIKALQRGFQEEICTSPKNFTSESFPFRIFNSIITAMNATFKLRIEPNNKKIRELISNGTWDVSSSFQFSNDNSKLPFLFPYYQTQTIAVVKLKGEISTLQKILHLWNFSVIIVASIAVAILTSVLTMIKSNFSSAILDTIRLLTYVSIPTEVRSHSFRIFYTTILILMIISNGVFQGSISAFLLQRERSKSIKTINELVESDFKIYIDPNFKENIEKLWPQVTFVEMSALICMDHLLNSTSRACFFLKDYYEENYLLFPVEAIKEPLSEGFVNHECRENWPLHHRFNRMWMRIVESGLFDFWRTENTRELLRKRRNMELEWREPQRQSIKFEKLNFAFELLAIGLFISIISFMGELLLAIYRSID